MLKSFEPTLIGADTVLPPQALSARTSSMPSANSHRTEQRGCDVHVLLAARHAGGLKPAAGSTKPAEAG